MPYGYEGAVVHWAIRDAPPSGIEELTDGAGMATKSTFKITCAQNQRGKKLYFSLCWMNHKGDLGPWSVIQETVIP